MPQRKREREKLEGNPREDSDVNTTYQNKLNAKDFHKSIIPIYVVQRLSGGSGAVRKGSLVSPGWSPQDPRA